MTFPTTAFFDSMGLTRDSMMLAWLKWSAFVLALATMGLDVTKVGIPATWVPYIQLTALFISVTAAQHRTSDLPADTSNTVSSGTAAKLPMTLLALVLVGPVMGCAKPPTGLTQIGITAFNQHEIQNDLDLLRNVAIDANKQLKTDGSPLLSVDSTRRVVNFHTSAIQVVHDAPAGWKTFLLGQLATLPNNLTPDERATLDPYFALIKSILQR